MHFETEKLILASPSNIWAVMTDKSRLLDGGFGILKLDGDIRPGGKIKLWSEVSPKRAFPLRVTVFDEPRRMVWEGGMPLGLFKGVRQFTLTPQGRGTLFRMREDYSGLLAGLIGRSIPNLSPSFEKFSNALKTAAEGSHS